MDVGPLTGHGNVEDQLLVGLAQLVHPAQRSPSYDDVELVVVNTCGFIDSEVQESLKAIGEVLAEAKRLKEAGVKEILVISQDTSAYGVDEVRIDEADEYDLCASLIK